jgi:hypothetical protein
MGLDDLKVGELKELIALLGVSKQAPQCAAPHAARPVIVCTSYRGVFFGYATDVDADPIVLTRARNLIYWATDQGGVLGAAEKGPTAKARVGARADVRLRSVTAVFEVTESAARVWEDAPNYVQ